MKKKVLYIFLTFTICSSAFSITELWSSLGLSNGNYFEKTDDFDDMYTSSLGLNINTYMFNNERPLGMFMNYGLLFPITNKINYYYLFLQMDFILGLGFRYNINEKLNMHLGFGPNFGLAFLENKVDNDNMFNEGRTGIGIGGDIGIKYNFANSLYIDVGTLLQYNFLCFREARNEGINYWVKNYSLFGIKPYIAIGFSFIRL